MLKNSPEALNPMLCSGKSGHLFFMTRWTIRMRSCSPVFNSPAVVISLYGICFESRSDTRNTAQREIEMGELSVFFLFGSKGIFYPDGGMWFLRCACQEELNPVKNSSIEFRRLSTRVRGCAPGTSCMRLSFMISSYCDGTAPDFGTAVS